MLLAPFLATGFLLGSLAPPPVDSNASPAVILAELKAGNQRFVDGRRTRSVQSAEDPGLRKALIKGQSPIAVIIACSDSRVETAFLFDQELGRLFTVREAGNSPDDVGLASVEYAVAHLHCRVVVLLGHDLCGAVKAVATAKGPLPGNLHAFQKSKAGLLESTPQRPGVDPEAYHDRLAEVNAIRQARGLTRRSAVLARLVHEGKLKIVPAIYDLATGQVVFLDEGLVTLPKPDHADDPPEY